MAHNIFGERFLGRREPAWHGLGQVFAADEQLSVSAAFQRADLLYPFIKAPMTITLPDGTLLPADKVAVLRGPTRDDPEYRHLTTVEPEFGIIQNVDLARRLDPLAEKWPVETVGALAEGATTFVTLATGAYEIAGDQLNRYLLISDGKNGAHALRIACVDIRVVCQNTLEAAWNGTSGLRMAFSHHAKVESDLQTYVTLFDQIALAQQRQQEAFQQLAATRITRPDAQTVLAAAFPKPATPKKVALLNRLMEKAGYSVAQAEDLYKTERQVYENAVERHERLNTAGIELYDRLCDSNPLLAGTAWAAYNAAAEVSDNRAGNAERNAAATLFGDRYIERGRAFRAAWELTGAAALN